MMPQITKITVSLGAKIPLVQYGSIDPSIFISADIAEGENYEDAIKELGDIARAQLAELVLPIALARLANTELAQVFDVVKGWEATKVLRMVLPHIDLSEAVTLGDMTVEKAQAIVDGWGSGTYTNGGQD